MPSSIKTPLVIPTPQDVLAQVRQQRQMMFGSGQVPMMHQATVQNALDSLFGNPEVKKARMLQERVKSAEANLVVQEGDDDVTAEIRRLTAIRDSVSDIDSNLASQINTQLLDLGTMKAERDKLKAQTVKEEALTGKYQADTLKAQVTAGTALNKDSREEALFPLRESQLIAQTDSSEAAADASRSLTAQRNRERINLLNPETGHMVTVPARAESAIKALTDKGYVESGKPTLQGSREDLGLTKGDRSKELVTLREQAISSGKLANSLGNVISLLDANPNIGTLPAEVAQFANTASQNLKAMLQRNGLERPDITTEGARVEDIVAKSLGRANAQLNGMVTVLVYAQAKSMDNGRLSNQDVEMFAKGFGQMSPQQMRDTSMRLLMEAESNLTLAAGAYDANEDQAVKAALDVFKQNRERISPKAKPERGRLTDQQRSRLQELREKHGAQ